MRDDGHRIHVRFRHLILDMIKDERYFSAEQTWGHVEQLLKTPEWNYLMRHINGFYAIFNFKTGIYEYVSESIRDNLGHDPHWLVGEQGISSMLSLIEPEHADLFVNRIMRDVLSYLSTHATAKTGTDFKFNCCMKLIDRNGQYNWYILDSIVFQTDENGFPYRTFISCTNIHHVKTDSLLYYNLMQKDENGVYRVVFENQASTLMENNALTCRETEVLGLIGQGLTNKQIAEKLHLTLNTVQTHRKQIKRKLPCLGSGSLAIHAFSIGLVE